MRALIQQAFVCQLDELSGVSFVFNRRPTNILFMLICTHSHRSTFFVRVSHA